MNLLLFKRTLALKQRKTLLLHTGFASKTVCAFVILFAVLLVTSPFISLAAEKPNTLVLPFKINTPVDETRLTHTVDTALSEVVIASPVLMRTFTLLPRTEAENIFDYTAWPPTFEALKKFVQGRGG